jgi:hypothetical protein
VVKVSRPRAVVTELVTAPNPGGLAALVEPLAAATVTPPTVAAAATAIAAMVIRELRMVPLLCGDAWMVTVAAFVRDHVGARAPSSNFGVPSVAWTDTAGSYTLGSTSFRCIAGAYYLKTTRKESPGPS